MSTSPPTFTDEKVISPNDAIGFLIQAKGNASLAAVYASKELNSPTPISEAQLIAAITNSDDPQAVARNLSSLTAQLRILLVLNTVEAFRITHTAYLQMIPHLSAKETANTYTKLLDALTVLATPPPPAQTNSPSPSSQLTAETLRALMPPEVQAALDQLTPPTSPTPTP